MAAHRAKISTESGAITLSIRGALGVTVLEPVEQPEAIVVEFVQIQDGVRVSYRFNNMSEFFFALEMGGVKVSMQSDGEVDEDEDDGSDHPTDVEARQ